MRMVALAEPGHLPRKTLYDRWSHKMLREGHLEYDRNACGVVPGSVSDTEASLAQRCNKPVAASNYFADTKCPLLLHGNCSEAIS
jgi:hypothetical protein